MSDSVVVEVRGYIPSPQGSKRHVGNGVMVESCKTVKLWRSAVADAAVRQGAIPIQGMVVAAMEFIFPRPKGHYGTGKNSSKLKPSAPDRVGVKPDLSKLIRSTEDALSGIAYSDDARICAYDRLLKRYAKPGELPGAIIRVRPYTGAG